MLDVERSGAEVPVRHVGRVENGNLPHGEERCVLQTDGIRPCVVVLAGGRAGGLAEGVLRMPQLVGVLSESLSRAVGLRCPRMRAAVHFVSTVLFPFGAA